MKFVLINSWYQQYSTGKLVSAFRNHLINNGHFVTTFYGHGKHSSDENVYLIGNKYTLYIHALMCRVTGYEGTYSTVQTAKVIKKIKEMNPDVVYLFNLHAYYLNEYLLLSYLKKSGVKVIYMLFDEYPYLGKCCFAGDCEKYKVECCDCPQKKVYPASLFFDRCRKLFRKKKKLFHDWDQLTLAGVEFLSKQAKMSAISHSVKFITIDMGVDLTEMYYPRDAKELKTILNIPMDNKVVVTVGPFSDDRKGIRKLVKIAKLCIQEAITFINIGFDGNDELLPTNFIGISYVFDQNELARFYSMADIYVMTSSNEGMSLTCMEALGCGCKLIGFNVSGLPYTASKDFAEFVPFDDLQAFANAIRQMEKKTPESIKACREYALSRYEVSDFVKNLELIGLD